MKHAARIKAAGPGHRPLLSLLRQLLSEIVNCKERSGEADA